MCFLKIQAKHDHVDVQRIAVRCLKLFGLLEKKPSRDVVTQLRLSFVKGPAPISIMACKALVDLGLRHNPQEIDGALGRDLLSEIQDDVVASSPVIFSDEEENPMSNCLISCTGLGEGFAKILLLSENYPGIPASLHSLLLTMLINLYFSSETKDFQR